MLHHRTMSTKTPIAVLDTNVMLDVYSCHDLSNEYLKGGDIAGPTATYRRARARESLLLAIYLHNIRATTYGLHHEVPGKLTDNVAPEAHDTWENQHTTLFAHFVKEEVLFGWFAGYVPENDKGLVGDKADDHLLAYAKQNGLPLITNEGFRVRGVKDQKLRKRAKAEGVAVFSPKEFYEGRMDEQAEIWAFFKRFADRAPIYIDQHNRLNGQTNVRDALHRLDGVYRHILFGETKDLGLLPVTVV